MGNPFKRKFEPATYVAQRDNEPARLPGESFPQYKARRAANNARQREQARQMSRRPWDFNRGRSQ